jgi:hypothetical protein
MICPVQRKRVPCPSGTKSQMPRHSGPVLLRMTKRRLGSSSATSDNTSVLRPPKSRSSRNCVPARHGPGVSASILSELLSNLPWFSAFVSQVKTCSTGRLTVRSAANCYILASLLTLVRRTSDCCKTASTSDEGGTRSAPARHSPTDRTSPLRPATPLPAPPPLRAYCHHCRGVENSPWSFLLTKTFISQVWSAHSIALKFAGSHPR